MEYLLDCSCGKSLHVTAMQAGSDVQCECGATLSVPSLSQLKQSVGQPAYEVGIIDHVRNLVREGELPDTDTCQQCGATTKSELNCTVVCELPRFKHSTQGQWRWMLFLISWPVWILASIFFPDKTPAADKVREFGAEVTVDLPLRMCPTCSEKFRSRRGASSELSKLIAENSTTKDIVAEYPQAEVYAVP